MKILIWSKDRACQLDIFLTSVQKFAKFTPKVVCLYKASSPEFELAYQKLAEEYNTKYPDFLELVSETDFYCDTIRLIDESNSICLCTDDSVFFGEFGLHDDLIKEHATFSYRTGFNTRIQHTHGGIEQPYLNRYCLNNDILSWKWTEYSQINDYGYPLSLDGHVYLTSRLMSVITNINFKNPNELEGRLFFNKGCWPQTMASYPHSRLVNVPVNNMSGITRYADKYSYPIDELNTDFLAGKRFKYDFSGVEIVGAHQELRMLEIT